MYAWYPGTRLIGMAFKVRQELRMKNSRSCAHVLQKTLNLVISRCCFAEDGKEMCKNIKRTCRAIVFLIKPIVLWRSRCRCRRRCLRRLTTVFLAFGWIFSNQYLAWKACFDFHHTSPTFQPMIKFYVLVGFQATAVTIATVTQSTSFWITPSISKSSQTLGNETFRI